MKHQNFEPGVTNPAPDIKTGDIKGLVLSGGASVRMGRDKGSLIYHDQPQKYHMATLLTRLGLDTYISISKTQKNRSGFKYIVDQYENIGPMAGLISAFKQHNTAWMVVACDYPLIETRHLNRLLAQRDKNKTATVFLDKTSGFFLPTIAIYESGFFPLMQESIDRKDYSFQQLLKKNTVKIIKVQDKAFKSINTPDAYKAIKKQIHEQSLRNT